MRFKKIILFISLISFAAILTTSCSQWEVADIDPNQSGGGPQVQKKTKNEAINTTDGSKTRNDNTLNLNTNN